MNPTELNGPPSGVGDTDVVRGVNTVEYCPLDDEELDENGPTRDDDELDVKG